MPTPPRQTPAWRAAMRFKVVNYTAKASRLQSAKWSYWAKRTGCRSVGAWLERVADAEVRRREREGGYLPPEKE